MWNSKNIASYLLLLASGALLPGCASDTPDGPDVPGGKADAYLRLQLQLETSDPSRSNPTGGEDGDGREDGQPNENAINKLDLVIYNSAKENAINTDAEATVKRHIVLSKEELNKFFVKGTGAEVQNGYYLVPVSGYAFAENDRILAYANADNLYVTDGQLISELRDLCPATHTWTGSTTSEADNFTMATARWNFRYDNGKFIDGKIYSEYDGRKVDGSKHEPFYVKCTVERTAARIDFMFNNSNKQSDKIVYSVTAPSRGGAKVGEVWISHIAPVNLMQRPSYYFKHVTRGLDDLNTVYVCEGETPDPTGQPTNYVMEPTTLTKLSGVPSLNDLFGATKKTDSDAAFTSDNAVSSIFPPQLVMNCTDAPDHGFDKYCILAYTNENTWTGTDFDAKYLTGLAFKAVYVPETVYKSVSGVELTESDKATDYKAGTTVYRYSPTNVPGGLRDAGYDVWFTSRELAEAYDRLHPGENGIITEYTDGVCYYNVWLRHANYDGNVPDPAEAIPMEYVIVRNNIYRLGVTFSGPGNPGPGLREPENIISRIFVRKWNVRRHSTIIM